MKVIFVPSDPHKCNLDRVEDFKIGTIVKCEDCEKFYIAVDSQKDGPYWGSISLADVNLRVRTDYNGR